MSRRQPAPVKLTRRRRHTVYAIGLGVWLSGTGWLVFHYVLAAPHEFGERSHPLEPLALKVHGAFGFAALWAFGLLWGVHVVNGWRMRMRRATGAIMAGVLALLGVTGYLLYYAGDEEVRSATALVHWIVGLVCPLAFLAHRVRLSPPVRATLVQTPVETPPEIRSSIGVSAKRAAAPLRAGRASCPSGRQ